MSPNEVLHRFWAPIIFMQVLHKLRWTCGKQLRNQHPSPPIFQSSNGWRKGLGSKRGSCTMQTSSLQTLVLDPPVLSSPAATFRRSQVASLLVLAALELETASPSGSGQSQNLSCNIQISYRKTIGNPNIGALGIFQACHGCSLPYPKGQMER